MSRLHALFPKYGPDNAALRTELVRVMHDLSPAEFAESQKLVAQLSRIRKKLQRLGLTMDKSLEEQGMGDGHEGSITQLGPAPLRGRTTEPLALPPAVEDDGLPF